MSQPISFHEERAQSALVTTKTRAQCAVFSNASVDQHNGPKKSLYSAALCLAKLRKAPYRTCLEGAHDKADPASLAAAREQVATIAANVGMAPVDVYFFPLGKEVMSAKFVPGFAPYIAINPAYFDDIGPKMQAFGLAHEVAHIAHLQQKWSEPFSRLGVSEQKFSRTLAIHPQRGEYAADWFAMQVVGRAVAMECLDNEFFNFRFQVDFGSDFYTHPTGGQRIDNLAMSNSTYLHFPKMSPIAALNGGGYRGAMMLLGRDVAEISTHEQVLANIVVLNLAWWYISKSIKSWFKPNG